MTGELLTTQWRFRSVTRPLVPALAIAVTLSLLVGAGQNAYAKSHVRVVTYKGAHGATMHVGHLAALAKTSTSFRRFINARLHATWRSAGGAPACKQAPGISIKKWRSDGFAAGSEFIGAPTAPPECGGGGALYYYKRIGGSWKVLLEEQDTVSCSAFALAHVPASIAKVNDPACLSDSLTPMAYKRYNLNRKTFFSAEYAASMAVALADQFGGPWAQGSGSTDVHDILIGSAYARAPEALTSGRCFTSSDPTYGRYLRGAAKGCLLNALWGPDYSPDVYVMLMARVSSQDSEFINGAYDAGRWYVADVTQVA